MPNGSSSTSLETRDGRPFGRVVLAPAARDIRVIDPTSILEAVRRDGAILMRGFALCDDRLRELSDRLCRTFLSYPAASRETVSEDATIQTVDTGVHAIPLHAELSYLPFRPELCFFFCARAAVRGGETTLCDGLAIARDLPSGTRALLTARRLVYEADAPADVLRRLLRCSSLAELAAMIEARHWQDVFTFGSHGMVHVRHLMPVLALHRPSGEEVFANNLLHHHRRFTTLRFEDGSLLSEELHAEIHPIAEALTCDVRWEQGDLLIVDNTRVMHGRRAIEDHHRVIHVRFGTNAF